MKRVVGRLKPAPIMLIATGTMRTTVRLSTAYRAMRQSTSSSPSSSRPAPNTNQTAEREHLTDQLWQLGDLLVVLAGAGAEREPGDEGGHEVVDAGLLGDEERQHGEHQRRRCVARRGDPVAGPGPGHGQSAEVPDERADDQPPDQIDEGTDPVGRRRVLQTPTPITVAAPAMSAVTTGVAMPSLSPLSTFSERRMDCGQRIVGHDAGAERGVGRCQHCAQQCRQLPRQIR